MTNKCSILYNVTKISNKRNSSKLSNILEWSFKVYRTSIKMFCPEMLNTISGKRLNSYVTGFPNRSKSSVQNPNRFVIGKGGCYGEKESVSLSAVSNKTARRMQPMQGYNYYLPTLRSICTCRHWSVRTHENQRWTARQIAASCCKLTKIKN